MTIEESDQILARLKPPPYDIDGWMIGYNEPSYHQSDSSYERFTGKAVRVGPWPDRYGWSDAYDATQGSCFSAWHKLTAEEKMEEIFRASSISFSVRGSIQKPFTASFAKSKAISNTMVAPVSASEAMLFSARPVIPYNDDFVVDPYGPDPYLGNVLP